MAKALSRWQPDIAIEGISDLAVDGRKVSGSAQRRKRNVLLFHGTILYRMQAGIVSRYLKQPKRQPDYRRDRSHCQFLRTIDASLPDIKQAIAHVWRAETQSTTWPKERMAGAIAKVVERSIQQEAECGALISNK
jgi:lipoate-protein ligase A